MRISKTVYLLWRDCRHHAWVRVHEPNVLYSKPLSVFDEGIIKQGRQIDTLARRLFPGGLLLERGNDVDTSDLHRLI